ncbi:MAG: hypothetical protein HOD64_09225, partial [Candidatus Cloacimonetes bacterium]|nr:hypothetical protein [Candidatus Cloacimonadota bacterium]
MKRFSILLFLLIVSGLLFSAETITTQLFDEMNVSSDDDFIRVNISFKDNYNSQQMISETKNMVKQDKRDYVTSTLKEFSAQAQEGLISQLAELESTFEVREVKSIWIVNVVNCEMTKNAINAISKRDEIATIDLDEDRNILLAPKIEKNPDEYLHEIRDGREITWNVTIVNAD